MTNAPPGLAIPSGRPVQVYLLSLKEGFSSKTIKGDGKNEFLRNFEKEVRNLLTKNNKCEILLLLKEMNEITVHIQKV